MFAAGGCLLTGGVRKGEAALGTEVREWTGWIGGC